MTPARAMVLAAGRGMRMRPLTDSCPKPLLPVDGRPMVERCLDFVADAGIGSAVVNLWHLGEMLRSHLAKRRGLPTISFSPEPELLDTGGGIVNALPLLGERPFAAMNADTVWAAGNPLDPLIAGWREGEMQALLLMVPRENALNYSRAGDFFLEGATPVRRGDAAHAPYIYAGAQIIHPSAFEDAPQGAFSLNLIWDRLLARGTLRAVIYDGAWVDVGTPAGLEIATQALREARR